MIRDAKTFGQRLWFETREDERRLADLEHVDPRAFARLVRRFAAGPRRRGRPRVSRALPLSVCQRLWKTYQLRTFDPAQCHACAVEMAHLIGAAPGRVAVIERGLKTQVVGTRTRELWRWVTANAEALRTI